MTMRRLLFNTMPTKGDDTAAAKQQRRRLYCMAQSRLRSLFAYFILSLTFLWLILLHRSFFWLSASTKLIENGYNYQSQLIFSFTSRRGMTLVPPQGEDRNSTKGRTQTLRDNIDDQKALQFYQSSSIVRKLPQWLQDYIAWHSRELQTLNETNWKRKKYLILSCTHRDGECGGVADRLKPLPLILAVAFKTRRLFFIRWTRPHPLENFLEPNQLQWSVPTWMQSPLEQYATAYWIARNPNRSYVETPSEVATFNETISALSFDDYQTTTGSKNLVKKMHRFRNVIMWETRVQDIFGGCALYEQVTTDSIDSDQWKNRDTWNPKSGWKLYQNMFHDLFRVFFLPSSPIQRLVDDKMTSGHLIPGQYVTAHYRAFYKIEDKKHFQKEKSLKLFATHAVNCASGMLPDAPIYFASDSKFAVDTIREYATWPENEARSIVTFSDEKAHEALHLDKRTTWQTQPSDYYATFVDLLLMSNGRCTSYGKGGFGLFGALISYDANCTRQHSRSRLLDCESNNIYGTKTSRK